MLQEYSGLMLRVIMVAVKLYKNCPGLIKKKCAACVTVVVLGFNENHNSYSFKLILGSCARTRTITVLFRRHH